MSPKPITYGAAVASRLVNMVRGKLFRQGISRTVCGEHAALEAALVKAIDQREHYRKRAEKWRDEAGRYKMAAEYALKTIDRICDGDS